MARKSRKIRQPERSVDCPEVRYRTALYVRLSVEDNGIKGDSLENQIELVQNYAEQCPDLKVVRTFADNGATGTDFDRPAFSEMMEEVKRGRINCIVVKDLSRFGRNYLETGHYLEKIFPYLGIRFISVNDHFDSLQGGKNDALLIPLKSILHDAYAKDISRKVSSAIDIRKRSGSFMGKIPPYGYVRDEQDRHRLRIHPERAGIVRLIFQWYMEGMGPAAIARRLNDRKIPTQFQLRYLEGHKDGKKDALWRGSTVTDLLRNPYYTGCTVERKESRLLYQGGIRRVIPESEWNLIEGTHEPIIDRQTFENVRARIAESRRRRAEADT